MFTDILLISGTANAGLAKNIASILNVDLGDVEISRFADNEIFIHVKHSIRGKDVFVIQPTCNPANDNLMELLIMLDTLSRASAGRITAVIPYYGYARQDRKDRPRVPISAKLVANLITVAGASRILAMDLHVGQIQGYFDIPVDHLYAAPVFIDYFKEKGFDFSNVVVVSPDAGGVERARYFAKKLGTSIAIIDKRREKKNEADVMNVVGDVDGKDLILVDDIIDTGGTIVKCAEALKKSGGKDIYVCASHPVLSRNAVERIENSPIKELIVSDSIPIPKEKMTGKIKVLSVAKIFAMAIDRIHSNGSVSEIFL